MQLQIPPPGPACVDFSAQAEGVMLFVQGQASQQQAPRGSSATQQSTVGSVHNVPSP